MVIDQGSRLSAVRLALVHACSEVLGLSDFSKDDLLENLDWLAENQQTIERKLYKKQWGETITKDLVLDCFKDLAMVEQAFSAMKTTHLHVGPVCVSLTARTRAHVFVDRLSYSKRKKYCIIKGLRRKPLQFFKFIDDAKYNAFTIYVNGGTRGLLERLELDSCGRNASLSSLCSNKLIIKGVPRCLKIPEPRESIKAFFSAAKVDLPTILLDKEITIATKKKIKIKS